MECINDTCTYTEFRNSYAFALKSIPIHVGCSCCSHVLWPDFTKSAPEHNTSCLGIGCHSFIESLLCHQVIYHRPESNWLILLELFLTESVVTGLSCLLAVHPAAPSSFGQYRFWSRRLVPLFTSLAIVAHASGCWFRNQRIRRKLFRYWLASTAIIGAELSCTKF